MYDSNDNLSEYLFKKGVKPSLQRMKILECLWRKNNHPTVDDVFCEVVKEIPTLSKTTVYNTLMLFAKANILKGLYIEEHEVRYDFETSNHGHFKCKKCGMIYDFAINIDNFQNEDLKYFKVEEKEVYFKGVCPKCQTEIIKN